MNATPGALGFERFRRTYGAHDWSHWTDGDTVIALTET
jgi:hypothetical protein